MGGAVYDDDDDDDINNDGKNSDGDDKAIDGSSPDSDAASRAVDAGNAMLLLLFLTIFRIRMRSKLSIIICFGSNLNTHATHSVRRAAWRELPRLVKSLLAARVSTHQAKHDDNTLKLFL